MQSGSEKFIFTTALVRSLETTMLGPGLLKTMMRCSDSTELFTRLQNTYYKEIINTHSFDYTIDTIRAWRLKKLFRLVENYFMDPSLIALAGLEYVYHNIKSLLRQKHLGIKYISLPDYGFIPVSRLTACISENTIDNLPEIIQNTITETVRQYRESESAVIYELIPDRFYFKHCILLTDRLASAFIRSHITLLIDLYNIKTLLRQKTNRLPESIEHLLYIPGGSIPEPDITAMKDLNNEELAESLNAYQYETLKEAITGFEDSPYHFENASRRLQTNFLDSCRYDIWGIAPLYRYVYNVKQELSLVCKIIKTVSFKYDRNKYYDLIGIL